MRKILSFIFVLSLCVPLSYAQLIKPRSSSIVTIGGESYYVHTVKKGETLYSLARLYSVSQEDILKNNPQAVEGLQPDQVLKIPVVQEEGRKRNERQKFDTHIVNQGETLYAISKRYGISVPILLEDNPGLDPAALSVGQELKIRKKSIGNTSHEQLDEQWGDYRDAINSVSSDYKYHLVEKGETLFSLSRATGISIDEIKAANDDLEGGLRAGAMIKLPVKDTTLRVTYEIKVDTQARTVPGTNLLWPGKVKDLSDSSSVRTGQPVGPGWFFDDFPAEIEDRSNSTDLQVALLLPLKGSDGTSNRNFLDFYQGVLLAMEDLKSAGISSHLNLYNTGRSAREVYDIVQSPDFENTDLILGPVYEECFAPVLDFARRERVAVVSPLATLEREHSPLMYQLAPDAANKYDKLREFLTADKNVVLITGKEPDTEMESELKAFLPVNTHRVAYASTMPAASFEKYVSGDRENVFVISCNDEFVVDEILAKISSMQNNLAARSIMNPDIRIIGNARWSRFHSNIDKNLYFKLKLTFVTSYHADRSDSRIQNFDKRYIAAFGSLPTLYSYRGYDAAKLFVRATMTPGRDFTEKVNRQGLEGLLQMPYHFVQKKRNSTLQNDQWALVLYNPDYTIEVK